MQINVDTAAVSAVVTLILAPFAGFVAMMIRTIVKRHVDFLDEVSKDNRERFKADQESTRANLAIQAKLLEGQNGLAKSLEEIAEGLGIRELLVKMRGDVRVAMASSGSHDLHEESTPPSPPAPAPPPRRKDRER